MGKTYNIGSKSDMHKFERDIMASVKKQAANSLYSQSYEIKCSNCGKSFSAYPGSNVCPYCRNSVELELNIDFK